MFAVIKTGGRQYRVVPNDVLEIGKIEGLVGTIVQLGEVLVLGGDTPVLGLPTVAGASVAAEVLQHKRGPKVIAFKKRRRKNSRRKRGYRDEITVLRITEILADNAKPSIGPRPKREKVAVAPAEGDDEAPKAAKKKAAPKKAAAKPAASKAAANKAAKPRAKAEPKKPAAKKAPAKGKSEKK
jgi:large subunit ribosomal protein L21